MSKSFITIVRDRASSGGGIYNYYEAIRPFFTSRVKFVGVGKPHVCYGISSIGIRLGRFTPLRLLWEWAALVLTLCRLPKLVHINPGLDIKSRRSLRRDSVNLRLAKLFRRKVLVFWRGWDNDACGAPEFPGGNDGSLARVYRMADAHVVLASDFEKDLRRWGFDLPIHIETTVVSDEILRASRPRKWSEGPVNILFLSRVEVAKGVFEMVEAARLLHERNPGKFRLTIAGDGPALAALKERVTRDRIENVSFSGFVTGQQRIEAYQNASLFCFLSYTEGMPNAVLEAMAMGLPLVSCNAGGLKDILRDGDHGCVLKVNREAPAEKKFSPAEVADKMEHLSSSPEIWAEISERNRLYARERFSAPVVAARLERIYASLLGSEQFVASADRSRTAAAN